MEASKDPVSSILLSGDTHLVVPPYQRPYEWTRPRWQNLINDVYWKSKLQADNKKHWLGIILLAKSKERCFFGTEGYNHKDNEIIDGQQRLLTLIVWVLAIRDYAKENNIILDSFKLSEIKCQESDAAELKKIINGEWRREWKSYKERESGLLHAYTYFRWILWLGDIALERTEEEVLPKAYTGRMAEEPIELQWANRLKERRESAEDGEGDETLSTQRSSDFPDVKSLLETTLDALWFMTLEIEDSDEPASELFDSLNGSRMELQQFDHVRNYIFRGIEDVEKQKELYSGLWQSTESALDTYNISGRGSTRAPDLFLYDFMISLGETKYQKRINRMKTSQHFARFFDSQRNANDSKKRRNHYETAKDLLLPALQTWILIKRFGVETTFDSSSRLKLPLEVSKDLISINSLSTTPALPLVMNSVQRFINGNLSESEMRIQIREIRNFLARLVITGTPLSPMRSNVMALFSRIGESFSTEVLQRELQQISPDDEKIKKLILPKEVAKGQTTRSIYDDSGKIGDRLNPKQIIALLQIIEIKESGNSVAFLLDEDVRNQEKFTLEHFYPRSPSFWREELGQWSVKPIEMDERKNVLGNLAVIPSRLNSKFNNNNFAKKIAEAQNPENKFPLLWINEDWRNANRWTPFDIDKRTGKLLNSFLLATKT